METVLASFESVEIPPIEPGSTLTFPGLEIRLQEQEWLGHSSFSTTANIYAHLDTAAKDTSAVKLNSALPIQASVQTSI